MWSYNFRGRPSAFSEAQRLLFYVDRRYPEDALFPDIARAVQAGCRSFIFSDPNVISAGKMLSKLLREKEIPRGSIFATLCITQLDSQVNGVETAANHVTACAEQCGLIYWDLCLLSKESVMQDNAGGANQFGIFSAAEERMISCWECLRELRVKNPEFIRAIGTMNFSARDFEVLLVYHREQVNESLRREGKMTTRDTFYDMSDNLSTLALPSVNYLAHFCNARDVLDGEARGAIAGDLGTTTGKGSRPNSIPWSEIRWAASMGIEVILDLGCIKGVLDSWSGEDTKCADLQKIALAHSRTVAQPRKMEHSYEAEEEGIRCEHSKELAVINFRRTPLQVVIKYLLQRGCIVGIDFRGMKPDTSPAENTLPTPTIHRKEKRLYSKFHLKKEPPSAESDRCQRSRNQTERVNNTEREGARLLEEIFSLVNEKVLCPPPAANYSPYPYRFFLSDSEMKRIDTLL